MNDHSNLWRGAALILLLSALTLVPRNGIQAQQTSASQKVILRAGDTTGRQVLIARNARPIADYGAFSLWAVGDRDLTALANASDGLSLHPEFDTLLLREGTLDTRALHSGEPSRARPGHQLHVVQFVGPVRAEWLTDLEATGAQIIAYVPYNGYVVWAGEEARTRIGQRVSERVEYQWHGPYRPAYRLSAGLRALPPDETVDVVVQVVNQPKCKQTIQEILDGSRLALRQPYRVLDYTNLVVRIPALLLPALAARADVFDVEPWQPPRMLDERQGQILAGNLNGDATQPSGPGYLAWLDERGFSQDPADYPIVDMIDDGFDNGSASAPGHRDFRRLGSFANDSRVTYALDLTSDGDPHNVGGHGTLNLSIAGGYNSIDDGPAYYYEDGAGYQYGLGISPYGRLASTKVFNDGGGWGYPGTSLANLFQGSYQYGARITSNSWGWPDSRYTPFAQEFDIATRDADPAAPGNQEMTHVVAAGNTPSTVNSPGTAKNVITVGASENYRLGGPDGCGIPDSGANNAQDIASFSARGPTADGRVKPDIVAPGTHVQGAASQDPAYDGSGVCDLTYWPDGQTLYTWSSGTSHATPAIAGAASLLYSYLARGMGGAGGQAPSPAMIKAYLLNSARYINGWSAGGTLPSNSQGWGRADLGMAFDGARRVLVDQSVLLSGSGDAYEWTGIISDTSKPLRVTLAWTDAPGSTTSLSWVNDLDLEVNLGGETYLGNVFFGSTSIPGGTADSRNNVESVFLPPGASGSITVSVIAANIAGDGVPGNENDLDQDFALVVYNARTKPDFGLNVSPVDGQVCSGEELTYTVAVIGQAGYPHTVSLAHSELPADVYATLAPVDGVPDFGASLHVTTHISAAVGLHTLVITGTSMDTHVATVTLSVDAVSPTGTVLISPTDGVTNVIVRPTLTWSASANARSYRVQIASDSNFTRLVADETVNHPSYASVSDLLMDNTYYWRVISQNGCGSDLSPAQVFTTVNQVRLFYDSVEWGPARWDAATALGTARWTQSASRSHSSLHAWFMTSAPMPTDARLTAKKTVIVNETTVLSFWHWHDMESSGTTAWDGGVLEASVDGGDWTDLGDHITSGGYTHQVSSDWENPLGDRSAWSGDSQGWQQVVVDLGAFAGSSVRIRFRWGGNSWNVSYHEGWYVDDVLITSIWPPSKHKFYLGLVNRNG